MSNIRKTFNFRDGVQVDDDDLVVRGGLVGIGSTVPTQTLDVNGNIRAVGLVTSSNSFVTGVSTTTELRIGNNISASASSGVITATAFYGDGATLSNLPTSQWIDIDVGLGFTSIYAAGNVGITTTDPRNILQIGANPNTGGRGVGFNSTGDIRASGVVTAYAFAGFGTNITNLNADNITNGTILNTFLPTIDNAKLPANINVSGVITATSGFSGNLTGNVTGSLTGIAQSASSLTGTPNINVGVITAKKIITDSIEVIQNPVGVATIANTLHVGTGGTGFSALSSGRVGIGTSLPTSEVQVRKNGTTTVEVLSNTGEARISIGQSVGLGNSSTVLRFGNAPGVFDILNRSTGSFNQFIHAGGSGVGTGNFNWIYGQTNNELMTLTYDGKLGIAKTNPDNTLHVVGTSTVTGTAYFGGDAEILGTLSIGSGANKAVLGGVGGVLANINLNNSSGITTLSQLNVLGTTKIGLGTNNPEVGLDGRTQTAIFNQIGVSTSVSSFTPALFVNGNVGIVAKVGIGTTSPLSSIQDPSSGSLNAGLLQIFGQTNIYNNNLIIRGIGGVGINSDLPIGALDLRYANLTASLRAPVYFPQLTTVQRNALTPNFVAEGALIYNTNNKRFELYNGVGGWSGITTAPVPVQIAVTGNTLTFTVAGVGATSLTLF